MYTIGLALTLRPGKYEGYKRAHDELWPELAEEMRAAGVNMAIYLDGNRLFLFAAAPSEADWNRSRRDPILAKWDKNMAEFLETDPAGNLAFTLLPKAFGFGEFES
jgi:L-rhamnose mutarotase